MRYTITVPAEHVDAHQVFEVNAESKEEASREVEAGNGEWVEDIFGIGDLDFANLVVEEDANHEM